MRIDSLLCRVFFVVAATLGGAVCRAQVPVRPPITALDHVSLYAQDPAKSEAFYAGSLHARKAADPGHPGGARYYFNSLQYIEVLPMPPGAGDVRLRAVGFATANSAELQSYLADRHYPAVDRAAGQAFSVRDPEGNDIEFSQPALAEPFTCFSDVSCHMIHAGFLVRNREKEDGFYLETLGFRPYWQGGMTAGKVDWVSQQVPNGPEWLEYMLTGPGSDHPSPTVDRADLGGMDHVSLAVQNMEATVTRLAKENRLQGPYNGPQIGRDGKWQTNLYDPDGTRIELMEADPSVAPCCSAYRAPHPGLQPTAGNQP